MTKTLTLRSFDIPALTKFGIGFDNMFDELMRVSTQQSSTNYPPYDIVQINDVGLLQEVRDRQEFVKPTIKRKLAKSQAKRRWQKYLRDQSLPKKDF